MLLDGDIPTPSNLLILNADPGMEDPRTYRYLKYMGQLCQKKGLRLITVPGPNLYEDLLNLQHTDKTRIDNPPFYTKSPEGKKGRLMQKCTQAYKIAPMDRFIRRFMEQKCKVSRKSKRIPEGSVHKWIGFSVDEIDRIKESTTQKYIRFVYPLVELKLTKDDCKQLILDKGRPLPPRSVCNACFANSPAYYKELHESQPDAWRKAVNVDDSIRNLTQVGINDECYVSSTLMPLRDLPDVNFLGDGPDEDCSHPGHCFI